MTTGILNTGDWAGQWITAGRAASGYHDNGASAATGNTKWMQVDLGSAQAITSVRLHPTNNLNLNQAAYGFPVRFKIEMSNDATFATGVTTITNQTGADYANPGANIVNFAASGSGRYVRVTATTLFYAPNNNVAGTYVFSLSQIEVVAGGQNVALGKTVTAADSLERNSEWARASLTDGLGVVGSKAVTQSDRLRTNFSVGSDLKRAVVSVCGLGQYEMTLNGAKVGADLLTPNWSNYNKTCYYNTYDVTSMLQAGPNAVGIALGNGFYNVNGGRYAKITGSFGLRRVIAQIRLEYNNGTVTTIGTDPTWKWSPGPATFSCVYGGEDVDGRLDDAGWDTAGFNSASWPVAKATTGPSGATLRGTSLDSAPTRTLQTFTPVASKVISTGVTVYDFGQNAAQIPAITTHGSAGSTVKLTFSEYVNGNGTIAPIVSPISVSYTLKGSGTETFAPKFFYMGYRYVQVELRDPSGSVSGTLVPVLDSISSRAITSSPGKAGSFTTSNTLFNNIHQLVYWSQVSNLVNGVLTDCPTREKLGWQEVTHFNGPALRYENDLITQFAKQANDIIEGQSSDGTVLSVLPNFGGWNDVSPEWGSSAVMVPWQQYLFTGDVSALTKNYASAKKFMTYLGSRVSPGGSYLLNYGLGDWYDLGPNGVGESQDTPAGLTATAIYYQNAVVLSQWAQQMGNSADATAYSQLAANIRTAFNNKFLNTPTGTYGVGTFTSGPTTYGSQTSNAMPLALGMVDPANKAAVLKAIVDDIAGRGYVVTSGDVGYRYLIRALADNGRSDVLFAINNRTNTPGYGYILSTGATALTEAWDASPANSHSLNHCMLGQIMEWFYADVAGIQSDPTSPGFKKIIIKPAMVGSLASVNSTFRSVRGDITSNWTNSASGLTMNVTIPAASTATIYVPAASAAAVQESNVAANSAPGVTFLRMENNAAVFAVGSGSYAFSSLAIPTAPTGLTVTAGSNGVRLSWTAPYNATQFNVKRATTSGGPYTTLTSGLAATAFNDTTAAFGVTYYYVVTASNSAAESANSNEASIALTAPSAPTGLTATAGNTVIQLSWSPISGVSGYRIKRSTVSGGPYSTVVVSSTPGTNYVDTGLTNGTTYYYTVTALVFTNEGNASAAVFATPSATVSLVSRATGGIVSTNYDNTGNANENITKVVDGLTGTKWFQNTVDSGVWIQYQFANGQAWAITRYQLTSANDVPGRDPAAWMFQGSNDGTAWNTLDTQTGQTFPNRGQLNTYNLTNATAYRYYRLFITADLTAGNGVQLAEIGLFSNASDGDPAVPLASRVTGGVISTNYDSGSSGENISKVVDGLTSTKWFQNAADSGVWIQYRFGNGQAWIITRYLLTSANDVPGRDPAAWMFQGSNDGTAWNTLDTQTGQAFASRGLTKPYNFTNTNAYRYYRLFITADLTSGNGIQLAEFGLSSSASDGGDKTAPILSLPAAINVTASSNDMATVSFNPTANDAVDGSLFVTTNPASGSQFPLGNTTVQCSATDSAGNTATGTFSITVNRAYGAPSGLNATAVSESQIRLDWTDNSTGESNYQIEFSPAGSGNWTVQTPALSAGSASGIVAGLSASTNYDLRVKATGPAGSSLYATITCATPAGVGDGIPGWWRYQYFGNGLAATGDAAANADPDGDGVTNAQEFAAGTNPKDFTSIFRVTQLAPSQNGWLISFPTIAGKTYRLQRSDSLQSGSWTIVQDNISGTGGVIQVTDPTSTSATRRFYRAVILP